MRSLGGMSAERSMRMEPRLQQIEGRVLTKRHNDDRILVQRVDQRLDSGRMRRFDHHDCRSRCRYRASTVPTNHAVEASGQSPKTIELHCAQAQGCHVLSKDVFQTIFHCRPPRSQESLLIRAARRVQADGVSLNRFCF